jgi:hypothetical protein
MSIGKRAGIRLFLTAAVAVGLGACGSGHLGPPHHDPDVSPGVVSLQLLMPSDRSFCDQRDTCGAGTSHLIIYTTAGVPLATSPGWCPTYCSNSCAAQTCRLIPCDTIGEQVNGLGMTWQGEIYEASTCGGNVGCVRARFVAPGRYVARMCATPGELTTSELGAQICTATGPEECVETAFDIPGPPVTVTLSSP